MRGVFLFRCCPSEAQGGGEAAERLTATLFFHLTALGERVADAASSQSGVVYPLAMRGIVQACRFQT